MLIGISVNDIVYWIYNKNLPVGTPLKFEPALGPARGVASQGYQGFQLSSPGLAVLGWQSELKLPGL